MPASADWVSDGIVTETSSDTLYGDVGYDDNPGALDIHADGPTTIGQTPPASPGSHASADYTYTYKFKWDGSGTPTSSFTVTGSGELVGNAQAATGPNVPYSSSSASISVTSYVGGPTGSRSAPNASGNSFDLHIPDTGSDTWTLSASATDNTKASIGLRMQVDAAAVWQHLTDSAIHADASASYAYDDPS